MKAQIAKNIFFSSQKIRLIINILVKSDDEKLKENPVSPLWNGTCSITTVGIIGMVV